MFGNNTCLKMALTLGFFAAFAAPGAFAQKGSTSGPTQVRDVDAAHRQPVVGNVMASIPSGTHYKSSNVLYTVPAGKKLVVDTVSLEASAPATGQMVSITFVCQGMDKGMTFFMNGDFAGTYWGNNKFVKTQQVFCVVPEGLAVFADAHRSADGNGTFNGAASATVTFSGYLVDAVQ